MKNYPNQAVEFDRVRNTLATLMDLNGQGADTLDDGVLGYELARRRFYTFRYLDYRTATEQQILGRIATEQQKDSGNQGARTNARELRRTLQGMGWVDPAGAVTVAGQQLLEALPGSQAERDLLADGLMRITAADRQGRVSHPVPMLLRLLNSQPSHHRRGLELALENIDDSQAEIDRVLGIYDQQLNDAQIRAVTGVSESQQQNARKVFPSLAKYAGLVTEDQQGYFHIAPPGLARLGLRPAGPAAAPPQALAGGAAAAPPSAGVGDATVELDAAAAEASGGAGRRRNLAGGVKRDAADVGRSAGRAIPVGLTPDQQAEAQNRLNERTERHQELVRSFAERIGDEEGGLYEGVSSYDLLWRDARKVCHVFEMKTIDEDADSQFIRAVGQLLYYEYFYVASEFPDEATTKTIVTDRAVHSDLCEFADRLGIGVIAARAGELEGINACGRAVVDLLPANGGGS